MSPGWHLSSCTQTKSARERASQAGKPLRAADRMPFKLSVIILSILKRLERAPPQTRARAMSDDFRRDFIRFAVEQKVLCFGDFRTKAGRSSPYFFNAGLFNSGAALKR